MVTITINNQKVEVEEGTKLLTTIESIGIKVPTLCHHKALISYGACRLCVVEVQVPGKDSSSFNQGIMDLGATICTPRNPVCGRCPVRSPCLAYEKGLQETLPITRKRGTPPRKEQRKA